MRTSLRIILSLVFVSVLVTGFMVYKYFNFPDGRSARVLTWLRGPDKHPDWAVQVGETCPGAVFSMPSSGFIGYLWDDSFRPGHRHQGIDVFGGEAPGITPVVAVYAGYLTRLPEWKSSLILRIPQDPLQPGRQIWAYYTHLADARGNSFILPDFPPGTRELFVPAGTPLGYQGNFSGDSANPVGVHLHFSLVRDDGQGRFLNELEIANTLDPSPYFSLPLNGKVNMEQIAVCE